MTTKKPGLIARWKAAEPVRLYLYSVTSAMVLALVGLGVVEQKATGYLLAVAAALFGYAGTESARASVVAPLSLAMPDGPEVARAAVDSVPGNVVQLALVREYAGRHRSIEQDAA